MQMAARTFGPKVLVLNARVQRDFANAFAEMSQRHAGAVMIADDAFFTGQREHEDR